MRLAGKVALVTGGSRGIGRALCEGLAREGARVAVNFARNATAAAEVVQAIEAAGGHAVAVQGDVSRAADVERLVGEAAEALGPITVLVNNAAHDERHRFDTVTPEYWDDRMAVNLRHQFFAAQAVHPMMKAAGGGSIINMGSVSWMIGQGGMPGYTAAKSAVIGLTRGLARDFGPDNIRVNSIAPGWIMTQRQIDLWLTPEGEEELMRRQCLKRKLYPDDIARVVLFLAADDSNAMTNQTYIVDGGWV